MSEKNRQFDCPFCSCFFFTAHDLALHLNAFSDKGQAHKEAFKLFHEFVQKYGSECLSDDFTKVEFVYPAQIIAYFEYVIKSYYGLRLNKYLKENAKFIGGLK